MTTEQLIALFVADLRPVDPRGVLRAVIVALAVGLAAALGVMASTFAFPPELLDGTNLEFLSIKLLFAAGIVATAAVFLPQLARPGAPTRGTPAFAFVPFALIVVTATAELAWTHSFAWPRMIVERGLTDVPSFNRVSCDLAVRRPHLGRAHRSTDRPGTRRRRRRSCCWRPRSFCVCLPLYRTVTFVYRALVWPSDRHMCCYRGEARSEAAAVVSNS
jgi:hypothetical protein